jgi:very-short-patch-repair endonuclease
VHPSVFALAGAPSCWEQGALAAVLAGGSGCVASHRAAARLWGLADWDEVDVSVDRPRLPRLAGVSVHRTRDLAAGDLTVRHGIPVMNPMRMLVDLGAVVPRWAVSDVLERALVARLVTIKAVEATLERSARRGRRGCGVLRRVLEERALGAERPDSLAEARMAKLLREHDLPMPEFQHRVVNGYRVDFAYPEKRLAIEVDGHEFHSTPAQLQADLARQNEIVAAGWTVLRFTWLDLTRRPGRVAALVLGHLGADRPA